MHVLAGGWRAPLPSQWACSGVATWGPHAAAPAVQSTHVIKCTTRRPTYCIHTHTVAVLAVPWVTPSGCTKTYCTCFSPITVHPLCAGAPRPNQISPRTCLKCRASTPARAGMLLLLPPRRQTPSCVVRATVALPFLPHASCCPPRRAAGRPPIARSARSP